MSRAKCLLVVALLALCLGATAGAALAADSWAVTDQSIPAWLQWDGSAPASVDTTNDGTTTWDSTYSLESELGPGTGNRWGLSAVPVSGTVAPSGSYTFDFSIVAPPLTTLTYPLPVGVSPGAIAAFPNDWVLAGPGGLINTAIAEGSTVITRFKDIQGDTAHAKFAFQIEELAGRVPLITTGFADGTFGPTANVSRGQLAMFLQRALKLPLGAYRADFTDVPDTLNSALSILACVDAGVVTGYLNPDGVTRSYQPANPIMRRHMAMMLARAMCGGDEFVPSGPATADFTDVAVGASGYDHIEYIYGQGVTTGYADGSFQPTRNVTRGQMAAFIYRAFIEPTPCAVVLGGPAVTAVDVTTASYMGWTSPTELDAADPGNAYVVFDAVRFDDSLVGPDGSMDVRFELTPAGGGAAIEQVVPIDAGTLTAAHAAAMVSGDPYAFVHWDMPALTPGGYTLKVYVTDENDVEYQAGRAVDLWVVPTGLSEGFESSTELPTGWAKAGPGAWTVNPVDMSGCNVPTNQGTTVLAPGGVNCLTVMPGGGARKDSADIAAYSFTSVATPAVDCSAYTTVSVSMDALVGCYNDYCTLDVSKDDGATWTTVWDWGYPDLSDSNDTFPFHEDGDPDTWLDTATVCPATGTPPDWWGNLTVDLSSYAAGSSRVKVRWTYESDPAACSCYGWLIDNVSITGS